MCLSILMTVLLAGFCMVETACAFSGATTVQSKRRSVLQSTSATPETRILECDVIDDNNALSCRLKSELYQLGASYNRGFSSSSTARSKADALIQSLEAINPETSASRGITASDYSSPLIGNWRMIWTTAVDVLVLGLSPVFSTGPIYQVFDPPLVTNVIDFVPRWQSLPFLPTSLLRARVTTRASDRGPNRIGLDFTAVQLQPVQAFGITVDGLLPPVGVDLPKLPGADSANSPGYFDVTYLDSELLIIRQNAPGGLFALGKVDSIEP
jgi:hypothetical protein